jgi:hypothetical protein
MHAQHPIIHHRAWRRIGLQPLGGIVAVFAAAVSLSGALPSSPAWAQTAADSTVTLTWTAPGDDGNVGRATSYDIR